MLDINSLVKIDKHPEEFILNAMKFNLENYPSHTVSKRIGKESFYFYYSMKNLSRFGNLIKNLLEEGFVINLYRNKFEDPMVLDQFLRPPHIVNPSLPGYNIYGSRQYDLTFTDRVKYFIIDKSGLSHGFVYGPMSEFKDNFDEHEDILIDSYYGSFNNHSYEYDCVINYNFHDETFTQKMDLDTFKKEFLPLPKHLELNLDTPYIEGFSIARKWESYDQRLSIPFIYRNRTRSCYLPFKELIVNHLELDDVFIKPKFNKNKIYFECTYCWRTRKRKYSKLWKGEISYNHFEIEKIDFVGEFSKDW